MTAFHTSLLILAIFSAAFADILLRKTASLQSLSKALLSPWVLGATALYVFQLVLFTYLFVVGAKLIHVGVMQTVLYATIIVLAGSIFFKESLTLVQVLGVILALGGIVLLNA